jgi:hypothetical protein
MAAGGYQREYLYEDYALWVRMIQMVSLLLICPKRWFMLELEMEWQLAFWP